MSMWWIPSMVAKMSRSPSTLSLRWCNLLLNRFTWKSLPPKLEYSRFPFLWRCLYSHCHFRFVTYSFDALLNSQGVVALGLQGNVPLNPNVKVKCLRDTPFLQTIFFLVWMLSPVPIFSKTLKNALLREYVAWIDLKHTTSLMQFYSKVLVYVNLPISIIHQVYVTFIKVFNHYSTFYICMFKITIVTVSIFFSWYSY